MIKKLVVPATMFLAASLLPLQLAASTFSFNLAGPGVSGTVVVTYGTATDATYPQAFEVTGIGGTFSDSNNGLNIVNASIGPLEPITHDSPEPTNLLAPHDFSKFVVTAGTDHGFLSFDNLYYPSGSPQTATDYQPHGGVLDIYGLLFDIGGGRVVNLWSNGDVTGNGSIDYGVAVATSATALNYVVGGVAVSPEPGAFALLGSGLVGMLAWRRRSAMKKFALKA